jgi:long-subunit fatty acid transport protein
LPLWLPLLLLAASAPAWAGTYDVFGTGARAIALGGAYTAVGDDIAGLYYNPAAITQIERLDLELAYGRMNPQLLINGRAQNIDDNRGFTLGGVVSTKILDRRLSLGLNFFLPDAHFMRFLVLSGNQPHAALDANANHIFTCLIGAGYQLTDRVSVGVGVNVLATEIGGVNFTINEKTPSEGSVFSDLSPSYALIAGVWARPVDWFRIGAAFRDKVEMHFSLPNVIHIPALTIWQTNNVTILRPSLLDLAAESNSHFSPRAVEFGVAFEPDKHWQISANLTWDQWSAMRTDAPYASVTVTGGLGDVFPTKPGVRPAPPDFYDTFSAALGVEGRPLLTEHWQVALRGGYRYRPTPVPDQGSVNNYLDADAHIFSLGVGAIGRALSAYLPHSLALDAYGQYQYSPARVYQKNSPDDFIGDLKFRQLWYGGGASLSVRF